MKTKLALSPIIFFTMFTASSSSSSSSNHAAAPALRSLIQQSRLLEDNNNDDAPQNDDNSNSNSFNLSQYSIKFEQCQTTKQYNGNNNNGNSILSTKRFVIFRLCPDNSCSTYGEYLIDMDSYLQTTIPQLEAIQEQYCEECNACAAQDDYGDDDGCVAVDLNTCSTKCNNIANMESNGYVDAAEYVQCGKVYENQNTGVAYYAGAMCSGSGSKIKIGLFADEYCSELADVDIDHYIKNGNGYNVKLSYHLLKQTFSAADGGAFVASCYDDEAVYEVNGYEYGAVSEMCQNLYQKAGKCESSHGIVGMASDNENYSSQLSNENQVCEFISKLRAGHYDQSGEIVLTGMNIYSLSGANMSDSQIFALAFFVVGTAGLALYSFYLRRKIVVNQRELI